MRPKTILITGASSGIGRALALEYAASSAPGTVKLALAARRLAELESLAVDLKARGAGAVPLELDVSDVVAVREAVRRADRELGSLDMVIANAGCGGTKHSSTLDWDEDVARVLDVNVRGAIATLVAALPVMVAQKSGQLVGVSSLAGRRGLPLSAVYSASKAALSTFLESLRIDLRPAGIHVTDVQPGFVRTPLNEHAGHPMPFSWSVEKAARTIVRRLERVPAVVAFPWQLALATSIARHLPAWLYDRAARAQAW